MRIRFLADTALAGLLLASLPSIVADSPGAVAMAMPTPILAGLVAPATPVAAKPRASLTAVRESLPGGRLLVLVTSNAKKVKLTYRTARNTKRTASIRIRRGAGQAILAMGSQKVYAQAAATSRLRRSLKVPVLPPVITPQPVTPAPVTATAVAAPVGTPPAVESPPVTPPVLPPPPPAPDDNPPGPVMEPTATVRSFWSIELAWTLPTDPDLASVEIAADGWTRSVDSVTHTFADTGLARGSTHTYTVRAMDTAGNASEPVTVSATIPLESFIGPATAIARVSTSSTSAQCLSQCYGAVWSPDGTKVAFESWSGNLVPGDTNATNDLFVKTLATGEISRVSTSSDGSQGDGYSYGLAWSPDGTRIAFASYATNLVVGDTNGVRDVFVKTLDTGAVERIATNATEPAWSPDGSRIAYSTGEIFIRTLGTDDVERVSSGSGAIWSPDGTRIAFESAVGDVVPGDTNNVSDVFVKTLATGAITRVSTSSSGAQGDAHSGRSAWSPDGTRLAFVSHSTNLVPDDANGVSDVFVKTLDTGAITRVSTSSSGAQGNGESDVPAWSPASTSIAFHSSATNLVPGDLNEASDVFVKSLTTDSIQVVSADHAGSLGLSHSTWPAYSPDATRIAFDSGAPNLVPGDTNGLRDVFVKELP